MENFDVNSSAIVIEKSKLQKGNTVNTINTQLFKEVKIFLNLET
jgi:hypothetical protein